MIETWKCHCSLEKQVYSGRKSTESCKEAERKVKERKLKKDERRGRTRQTRSMLLGSTHTAFNKICYNKFTQSVKAGNALLDSRFPPMLYSFCKESPSCTFIHYFPSEFLTPFLREKLMLTAYIRNLVLLVNTQSTIDKGSKVDGHEGWIQRKNKGRSQRRNGGKQKENVVERKNTRK